MPEAPLPPDLPGSLDAVHVAVREAFQRRDLTTYLEYFAADLSYRDADGRVQTREELGDSVRGQLERLVAFTSSFERESLQAEAQDVVETGTQIASISLRWLFIFATHWTVRRRGRYTWRRRRPGGWELRRVELYEERIARNGMGVAVSFGRGTR
jgi:hypothetical protein